jgi:hypothetical protein
MPSHARNSPIVEFPAAYTMSCGMVQREGMTPAMPAPQYGKKRARGKALPASGSPLPLIKAPPIRMDNIQTQFDDLRLRTSPVCATRTPRVHSTSDKALGGIQFTAKY